MSGINFKVLVEQVLFESLETELTPVIRGGTDQFKFEDLVNKADKYIFEKGKYEKNDTILSFKVAWPQIDTIGYILKVLVDSKLLTPDEAGKQKFIEALKDPEVKDGTTLIQKIGLPQGTDIITLEAFVNSIDEKLNYYRANKENYRNYSIIRFRQLNDKTITLAAEQYLPLTPHDGIVNLLKEYGGYDIKLVENIISYPGETRYTQKSNIEGLVMATIVEISKLMLVFYREYVVEQKEVNAVVSALELNDVDELKNLLINFAGKVSNASTPAAQYIQNDYINFTRGKSIFAIDPGVQPPIPDPTVEPPTPLIQKISDFQGLTGTGQLIYQSFLQLFNNIKKGPAPSLWKVAGKRLDYLTQALGAVTALAGHSLYGGTR
jgi:hypothetical protein